jgi:beta-lactamase class A
MVTISDNAATDRIIEATGLDRINARAKRCGCVSTVVVSDVNTMLANVACDMGFGTYEALLDAQSGRLGGEARARSTDRARLDAVRALDPAKTSRTTARDMTKLLAAVWSDAAAGRDACRNLRTVMHQQVTRRLEPAVPDSGQLAAKSGGLFGRVRNEIGVITYPDVERYAVAVFTQAKAPFIGTAAINATIGLSARIAENVLSSFQGNRLVLPA